jgi:hypothetical protein
MRGHAGDNDFDKFREGLHGSASEHHARKLFNATRNGMGLKEQTTRLTFGAFLNEQRSSI